MVPVLNLIIHSTNCSPTCLHYTLILYYPRQSLPSGLSPLGFPTKGHLSLVRLLHWFDWYDVWWTEQFMGLVPLYGRIVRFVAGLLLRKYVLDLGPLGMGFEVDVVVLGLIFLRLFRFCLFCFISPLFYIRNSLTYKRRYIILAVDSTVKKINFSLPLSLSSLHYFNLFARNSLRLCTYLTLRYEILRHCLIRDEF
jgi:hypothetical protein